MICEWLSGVPLSGSAELVCDPSGWPARVAFWGGLFVSALSLVWLGFGVIAAARSRVSDIRVFLVRRILATVMVIACSALLALAASRPAMVASADTPSGHVAVVIDVSDSITRDPGSFVAARDRLADLIDGLAAEIGRRGDAGLWSGSITLFADGASQFADKRPLSKLSSAIRSMRSEPVSNARGSSGAAGLRAAAERIAANDGAGLIVLLSDGNWLTGDTAAELRHLRRANLPVYVIPAGSRVPGAGIVAANLAAETNADAPAVTRLVVRGDAGTSGFRLTVRRDDADSPFVDDDVVASGRIAPIRVEHRFSGRGLRYLEFKLRAGDGIEQTRRMFTLVKSRTRVLVFGSALWVDRLNLDKVEIIRGSSDAPPDPEQFDVILLDGVPPGVFPAGYPLRLAEAVAGAGRGVFLINGPHSESAESMTVIGAWQGTPLEPLLPVDLDPRSVVTQPLPRDVAMIVDTSGSMAGWPLGEAVAIGRRVLDLLRPVDSLKIIAFSSGHREVLRRTRMTEEGKRAATSQLQKLRASGGSFAGSALESVSDITNNSCAIFFLSDGFIEGITHKPGCETVVFEISGDAAVRNRELERLGQVIAVDKRGLQRDIQIRYLEPEVREERWRKGVFTPLSLTDDPTLAPPIPTEGLAIAYPRPEADRLNVHPDAPPDPLVAFRDDKRGAVGVFLSDFGGTWAVRPDGLAAMQAYIDRLTGWTETERYQLKAYDGPGGIELELLVLADAGDAIPERIVIRLTTEESEARPIQMEAVPGEFGLFRGRIRYTGGQGSAVVSGILEIGETGRGSPTRAQRIPVRLPRISGRGSVATGGEIWTYGINQPFLVSLANVTGGRYLELGDSIPWRRGASRSDTEPVHAWVLAVAALLFVGGISIGGAKP